MYVRTHAHATPDKAALIDQAGAVLTYAELDARSNQLAHYLRGLGLTRGDHIAAVMENCPTYLVIVWAALRSGLYVTPVNSHLTGPETGAIVKHCEAQVLLTSERLLEVAAVARVEAPLCRAGLVIGSSTENFESFDAAISGLATTPVPDESQGSLQYYSSGTTGQPKAFIRPLPDEPVDSGPPNSTVIKNIHGFDEHTIYLSPAPLYHAAPSAFSVAVQTFGGTVVLMERFDAREALRLIEAHRVSHSQWVPTMFVRMLGLPEQERTRFDHSSLRHAVHSAAPCSIMVKQAMIDWWGPIITEYYGGSEGIGGTWIDSEQWLSHHGSVGKSRFGVAHIVNDGGLEVPVGQTGVIYFENREFDAGYAKDPDANRSQRLDDHPDWATYGDVGYVDDEGYIYLTDRASFMIVSGGVNIYPREIEDVLSEHPAVADVAVIGVPNEEFGEEVKAIVELWSQYSPSDELAEELIDWCRPRLAGYKRPRSVEFIDVLPRMPTGKLAKGPLRAPYWVNHDSRII